MNEKLRQKAVKYLGKDFNVHSDNFNLFLEEIGECFNQTKYNHPSSQQNTTDFKSLDKSENEPSYSSHLPSAKELSIVLENLNEVFFSVDMQKGRISYISPACEKVYGYSSDIFYQNNTLWYQVVFKEDHSVLSIAFDKLRKKESANPEYKIKHSDNSIRWLRTGLTASYNEAGWITRIDGVTTDITLKKKAEAELNERNLQLQKSNEELDSIIYNLSHDLKAPLSSMLGLIEIIKEDSSENHTISNLSHLQESVNKLDRLINKINENSINSRRELIFEKINFSSIINKIINEIQLQDDEFLGIEVDSEIKENGPFYTDINRIQFLLNCLIENAFIYSRKNIDKSKVTIKISSTSKESIISINDNGIGIAKEKIPNIFNLFYQVKTSSSGSGMGLYISKEIVSKLKGSITVESEQGVGTAFKVIIPNNFLTTSKK